MTKFLVYGQDGMKRQGITHVLNLIGNNIYNVPWMGAFATLNSKSKQETSFVHGCAKIQAGKIFFHRCGS